MIEQTLTNQPPDLWYHIFLRALQHEKGQVLMKVVWEDHLVLKVPLQYKKQLLYKLNLNY